MNVSVDQLAGQVGREVGVSRWLLVDQDTVDAFAETTGDHAWIHTDPQRASASPFGGTIAHGFLTLSLASQLLPDVLSIEGARHGLNYGLNRVRFPAPLRVGEQVRMRVVLENLEVAEEFVTMTLSISFETKAGSRPVCVASWIVREYLEAPDQG